jgi:hypothetical protein
MIRGPLGISPSPLVEVRKPTGVNPKQNLLRIPNVNYHATPNYHHVLVQCMINAVQDVTGISYLVVVQTAVASLQLNLSAILRVERIENTHLANPYHQLE